MVVHVLVNDNKQTKSHTGPLAASSDAMGYRKRNQIVFITNDSLIGQWPDFVVCCLWQRNRQQNDCPMNETRVLLCGVLFGGYLCRGRKDKCGRAHSGWNGIWNGLRPSRTTNAESRRRERKNDNSCPMVLKWTYPPWRPRHEREEEKQFIAVFLDW